MRTLSNDHKATSKSRHGCSTIYTLWLLEALFSPASKKWPDFYIVRFLSSSFMHEQHGFSPYHWLSLSTASTCQVVCTTRCGSGIGSLKNLVHPASTSWQGISASTVLYAIVPNAWLTIWRVPRSCCHAQHDRIPMAMETPRVEVLLDATLGLHVRMNRGISWNPSGPEANL